MTGGVLIHSDCSFRGFGVGAALPAGCDCEACVPVDAGPSLMEASPCLPLALTLNSARRWSPSLFFQSTRYCPDPTFQAWWTSETVSPFLITLKVNRSPPALLQPLSGAIDFSTASTTARALGSWWVAAGARPFIASPSRIRTSAPPGRLVLVDRVTCPPSIGRRHGERMGSSSAPAPRPSDPKNSGFPVPRKDRGANAP